jgi:predicted MFS family arabinose efflux permease
MGSPAGSLSSYVQLVRANRNFRRLWCAQIISELGDWFYALSIYNLLLQFTGEASSVALAVVLQVLPQVFVGPTAGVVNDRMMRKRVMIAADLARMVIVSGMLLVRSPQTVWLVYPLLFLETTMASFFEPARNAVIPTIVGMDRVLTANTLSSTTWSFNLAVGSALGGVAAVLFGRDAVFVFNALSFLASATLIRSMHFAEPHTAEAPPLRARDLVDFSPVVEGVRYIRKDSRLFATLFLKMGLGFMGANNVILPLLGERVFPVRLPGLSPQRGAILGMSLLLGARGVGAVIGPLTSSAWARGRQSRLRSGVLIGFLAAALGYLAVGAAPSVWLAIAAVMVAHAGGSTIWVFSTTMLQIYADDRFRGRVFSAELSLFTLTVAASSYVAGRAIDWGVRPRQTAILTGLGVLLPAVAWAVALRTRKWD